MFENCRYLRYFKKIFKGVLYKKMLRNTCLEHQNGGAGEGGINLNE
jgi:hypothetical protein